jgi:hypothetical protein
MGLPFAKISNRSITRGCLNGLTGLCATLQNSAAASRSHAHLHLSMKPSRIAAFPSKTSMPSGRPKWKSHWPSGGFWRFPEISALDMETNSK